jgi:hypothetical protein
VKAGWESWLGNLLSCEEADCSMTFSISISISFTLSLTSKLIKKMNKKPQNKGDKFITSGEQVYTALAFTGDTDTFYPSLQECVKNNEIDSRFFVKNAEYGGLSILSDCKLL